MTEKECELLEEIHDDLAMLIDMMFDLMHHLGAMKDEPEEESPPAEQPIETKRLLQ